MGTRVHNTCFPPAGGSGSHTRMAQAPTSVDPEPGTEAAAGKAPAIWSHTPVPILSAVSALPPARIDPWPLVYNGSAGTTCVSTLGTLAHVLCALPWFPCWDRVTDLPGIGIYRHDRMHEEPRALCTTYFSARAPVVCWRMNALIVVVLRRRRTSSHTRLDPPESRSSLTRRTASMTTPAEFAESRTLSSTLSGTSPAECAIQRSLYGGVVPQAVVIFQVATNQGSERSASARRHSFL